MKKSEVNVTVEVGKMLGDVGVHHVFESENINSAIDGSLKNNPSKTGGSGGGIPDVKFQFEHDGTTWFGIIENKSRKLAKLDRNKLIANYTDGAPNYAAINSYALNGAYYYARNAYRDTDYKNYFVIACAGAEDNSGIKVSVYIITPDTGGEAIKYKDFTNFSFLDKANRDATMKEVEEALLTPEMRTMLREKAEQDIDDALKSLNQQMRDDFKIDAQWRINIVVAMILAGIGDKQHNIPSLKVDELKGSEENDATDADLILRKIKNLLKSRALPEAKQEEIVAEIKRTIKYNREFNIKGDSGETVLRSVYRMITQSVLPFAENKMLDFAGAVYNQVTAWMPLPDDEANDVVLTPRYVIDLMVALARVDKDSYVWDLALGSGGFLMSAMHAMLKNAKETINNPDDLKAAEKHIKEKQLLGVERRGYVQMLAILNMFLVGDGSSNILNKDSLSEFDGCYAYPNNTEKFPANVFLLNPPYSAPGNGMVFAKKALGMMKTGWAAVIIQDSAGSGKAATINQEILKQNTLFTSVKMPVDIFIGKSSVQTSIYVFQVGQPHSAKHKVRFIDFRNDGYKRANRKKANKANNLRDIGNAADRYAELVDLVLYGNSYLNIFKQDEEYVEACIDPASGADWNFEQHKKIDTRPTEADFRKTVGDYLAWEVSQLIKNGYTPEEAGNELKK